MMGGLQKEAGNHGSVNGTGNESDGLPGKVRRYSSQIGQDLLRLAKRAYAEGKISEVEWQKLRRHGMPLTPEGKVNLILSQKVEKQLIEVLLETYG